jgi:hypothetical protein
MTLGSDNQRLGDGDARDQVLSELAELGPLGGLAKEVREYPLRLLNLVIEINAQRGVPVPDHLLKLSAHLGETALRALEDGGFVEKADGQRYAIRSYVPTVAGKAMAARAAGATVAASDAVRTRRSVSPRTRKTAG